MTKQLIAQHGSPEAALEVAVKAATQANRQEDLYGLSIWRDVKWILGDNL